MNGWSVSGITTFQDGLPIQITSFSDNELLNSSYYTGQGSPNIVKPFTTWNPKTHGGLVFDPTIFNDNTALGVFGNAARSYCCAPGIQEWDFALHKNIHLSEARYFELRGEFFNIFNHTNFGNTNGNPVDGEITDSTFGKVQSALDPRLVQLGLKFFF